VQVERDGIQVDHRRRNNRLLRLPHLRLRAMRVADVERHHTDAVGDRLDEQIEPGLGAVRIEELAEELFGLARLHDAAQHGKHPRQLDARVALGHAPADQVGRWPAGVPLGRLVQIEIGPVVPDDLDPLEQVLD